MQRRQFIKTIAAAASAPLMPANMLNASPLGTGIYTKAVGLTQSSACLSSSFLKNTLGLDDSKLKILVSRLETDGLVGQAGNSGLLFSKNCFPTRSILPLPPAQVLTQNEASPPPKARAQKIKDTSPKKLDFAQDDPAPLEDDLLQAPDSFEIETEDDPETEVSQIETDPEDVRSQV